MVESTQIKFQPVRSMIDVTFWLHFTNMKLDEWKLQNPKKEISATISLPMSQSVPSNLQLTENSFKSIKKKVIGGLLQSQLNGVFYHFNTIEEYSALNINEIIKREAEVITKDANDIENANRFVVLSFGDLKNYYYHSMFIQIELQGSFTMKKSQKIDKVIPKDDIQLINKCIQPFINNHEEQFIFVLTKKNNEFEYSQNFIELLNNENAYLCYFDPSPQLPSQLIKNHLAKLNHAFQNESSCNDGETHTIKILSIRDKLSKLSQDIQLNETFYIEIAFKKDSQQKDKILEVKEVQENEVKKNVICLKEQLDAQLIAENAVDLNLKLMKWRMSPGLNLEILQKSSCLLLGSGSLGCQVSRNLLSWGFRKITFVDNGKVSYSNPVRQCLFTFEDSQRKDNDKAFVAAQRLKEIFPSVITRGEKLLIPMPGHAIGSNEDAIKQVIENMNKLEELIKEHDVIFLLTDSRESRWLPTVQALVHNKICLTIALGFESFVVMRHGLNVNIHDLEKNGNRLGCYFCNDIVAPRNSLADRTLDQQCTVSRPALCCIASSLGVELLTSLLNHPLMNGAKANEDKYECDRSELGILPQQIRGDLSTFNFNVMYGEAFEKCIGCSQKIVESYISNREEFLLKACNTPDYLEDITGITAMIANIKLDDIENFEFDEVDEEQQ